MTKSDILGWTLAEVALALLFAVVAIFTPRIQQLTHKTKWLENENKRAVVALSENDKLRAEETALRAAVTASRVNLKSRLTPPCSELDPTIGWLFTATVKGPDAFAVNGKILTLGDIRNEYSAELADAKKKGCVERVRIDFEGNMSADTFDRAKRRLDTLFYSASLGQR